MAQPCENSLRVRPTTPAEFVESLCALRRWAGEPSLRRIQQLAGTTTVAGGDVTYVLPRSTVSAVLRGDRLPRADFVDAFVAACLTHRRRSPEEIADSVEEWLVAWRTLSAGPELTDSSGPQVSGPGGGPDADSATPTGAASSTGAASGPSIPPTLAAVPGPAVVPGSALVTGLVVATGPAAGSRPAAPTAVSGSSVVAGTTAAAGRHELVRAATAGSIETDAPEPRPPLDPVHPSRGSMAPPRQLPPDGGPLTGRDGDLDLLNALVDRPDCGRAVVISGMAGVGKSALSVHWAHRTANRFPDGQLYLDLGGSAPSGPLATVDALGILLRGLGVPVDRIGEDLDSRLGAYRTLLVDRRVLVVLDDALNSGQARPLLPTGPGCFVVVTSRNRLSGLAARDGARRLNLDRLAPDAAREVLHAAIGVDRPAASEAELNELARLCDNLPLALRIAGTNLADRPEQSVRDYAVGLGGGDRLMMLAVAGEDEDAVRAAFDGSYRTLDREVQQLFRRLGLLAGIEFGPETVALVAQISSSRARGLLGQLAAAHLVEPVGADHFTINELLHEYARERADAEEPGRVRGATAALLVPLARVRS